MEKLKSLGRMPLGTRLRVLSEMVLQDAQAIFDLYEVPLRAKWWPIFQVLAQEESGISVNDIAKGVGTSHPAVVKTVREMKKAGIVGTARDKHDRRKTNVLLTEAGRAIIPKIKPQYADISTAADGLLDTMDHDLWKALDELEYLLQDQSIYRRVLTARKARESAAVEIIPYEPAHATAFKALNQRWIEEYFVMEQADHDSLDNPQSYILDKGGEIWVARYEGRIVGVCALIKMNDERFDYEMAKMAVDPSAQGKSIGYLLGKKIMERAAALGGRNVYLDSNTRLVPALRLYEKLGFRKVQGIVSPYDRCNIQMVVEL